MRWDASTWVMVVVMACLGAWTCHACNEVVCASVVSKCMLTQACKCDLTRSPDNNCTCCRDCAKCLGYLYTECCSCLGESVFPSISFRLLVFLKHFSKIGS